jgi:hypothetical protein
VPSVAPINFRLAPSNVIRHQCGTARGGGDMTSRAPDSQQSAGTGMEQRCWLVAGHRLRGPQPFPQASQTIDFPNALLVGEPKPDLPP